MLQCNSFDYVWQQTHPTVTFSLFVERLVSEVRDVILFALQVRTMSHQRPSQNLAHIVFVLLHLHISLVQWALSRTAQKAASIRTYMFIRLWQRLVGETVQHRSSFEGLLLCVVWINFLSLFPWPFQLCPRSASGSRCQTNISDNVDGG